MAIKDILLHLDSSPGCQARIDLAVRIAKKHGAHLKGLHVLAHDYYAPRHTAAEAARARAVDKLFSESTAAAGISAEWLHVDWSIVGVKLPEIITLFTYYTDLVIIGQPNETAINAGVPFDLPERLGLAGGKPLLIVPQAGDFSPDMDRVMVAWKAGRESSRALYDSLPLLAHADHLSIVTVATAEFQSHDNGSDKEKLAAYLSRHRLSFTHEQILTPLSHPIGDALLQHARDQQMNLLVIGGFAASRRGAFMLGPVARQLMNHMTLPVLLSH